MFRPTRDAQNSLGRAEIDVRELCDLLLNATQALRLNTIYFAKRRGGAACARKILRA